MVMLIVTIGSNNVNWYIIITNAEHELFIEGGASAPDEMCYYIFIMERSDYDVSEGGSLLPDELSRRS